MKGQTQKMIQKKGRDGGTGDNSYGNEKRGITGEEKEKRTGRRQSGRGNEREIDRNIERERERERQRLTEKDGHRDGTKAETLSTDRERYT